MLCNKDIRSGIGKVPDDLCGIGHAFEPRPSKKIIKLPTYQKDSDQQNRNRFLSIAGCKLITFHNPLILIRVSYIFTFINANENYELSRMINSELETKFMIVTNAELQGKRN